MRGLLLWLGNRVGSFEMEGEMRKVGKAPRSARRGTGAGVAHPFSHKHRDRERMVSRGSK